MNRPLIGITATYNEQSGLSGNYNGYSKAVLCGGGIPLFIPCIESLQEVKSYLRRLDGLILSGGPDLNASWYGLENHPDMEIMAKRREDWDMALAKEAVDNGKIPLLGICLGIQELNVACGGTLLRHVPEDIGTAVEHRRVTPGVETYHEVTIEEKSELESILGTRKLTCNSSHHQAVGQVGKGFKAVAWASDGCVEAIEPIDGLKDRFALGVQWHPERIVDQPKQDLIFKALVQACL